MTGVLSNVSEEAFMFALKTVPGMSRFVLDSAQAAAMETGETIMAGGKIKTGFINAKYIAVDSIMSANYAAGSAQEPYSSAGTIFDLRNGMISAKNFAVTSTGDAYFKGTIEASTLKGVTLIASTIKNAETNPTFEVTSGGKITSKNAAGTSVTTIEGGLITTNNVDINGGDRNIGNGVFHVDSAGALTATSATITGTITSSNATITGGSLKVGSNFTVGTDGKLTATSATITGKITATSGTIGNCSIDANGNLVVPSARISGTLSADKISGGTISASTLNLGNGTFKVTTAGAMTATSGTIGGWTIGSSDIHNTNSSGNYVTLSNGTNSNQDVIVVRTGSSGNYKYPFYLRANGTMVATNATISGAITATSLSLGSGVTIPYGNISSKPDLTVYVQKDGTLGTVQSGKTGFKVSSAGLLQASNAVIYGTIYASNGSFTGTVDATSMTAKDAYKIYATINGTKRTIDLARMSSTDASSPMHLLGGDATLQFGDSSLLGVYIRNQVVVPELYLWGGTQTSLLCPVVYSYAGEVRQLRYVQQTAGQNPYL